MEFTVEYNTEGKKLLKVIEDSTDSVFSPKEVELLYTDDEYKKLVDMVGIAIDNGVVVEMPMKFTRIDGFSNGTVSSCMRIYNNGDMEFVIETEYGKLVTEEMTI